MQTFKDIELNPCLLYTSDAADERSSVDLGGRRLIKQKKKKQQKKTNVRVAQPSTAGATADVYTDV